MKLSPVKTSKFSFTNFLTSSLTSLYDGQVFLRQTLFVPAYAKFDNIFSDNFYEAA